MFITAHAIPALALAYKRHRYCKLAIAVGAMFPDFPLVLPAAIYAFYRWVTDLTLDEAWVVGERLGDIGVPEMAFVGMMAHSLLLLPAVYLMVVHLVFLDEPAPRWVHWFFAGWGTHIAVDIVTHPPPHPYLWPLSSALTFEFYLYDHRGMSFAMEHIYALLFAVPLWLGVRWLYHRIRT
jgi:hypothetical protein